MIRCVLFLLGIILYINAYSQKKDPVAVTDSILFKNVKYRLIGPFRGGRSTAVCGDLHQKNLFYMGATGGGVWKTTDGGSNWKNISDKFFGGSIGCVAVAPSDASVIYVGEGENSYRGNVSEGFGMWRSEDAGRTWKNTGLKDTRHILRIVIHPKNPDIVWVAAGGHLFGPNEERGIFKTTDGGKSWKKVLFSDKQSGAADLVMEPGNPNVLYASTWTVIRTPYSLESGGSGSALWKSTDGGETWKKLNDKKGFPSKSVVGIIGLAVAPSNPDKVYAVIENENGGLYVSNDAGETWTLQNSSNDIRQRAWYYSKVFTDPKNAETVYVLNVEFWKSTDGGKTFKSIHTPHGDHHDLWIDPNDGNRMIIADDGGAQISFDGGNNWSTYQNQPTAQIYRVSTDNHYPYRILGAQQDNSTIRILSRTSHGDINRGDWSSTAGFESGYVIADPTNPDIVYGGNYGGFLSRLDHKTGENRVISVWPDNPIGAGADVLKYRFQWNFPIFFSPHNPKRLYAAGNMLFVSEDEGASWTALSGDLTTNDKSKQKSSGGPITKDNTSVEYYCTIFTAAECALEKDVLWTGSDDGLIYVSRDGGKSWQNVTPPAAGKGMMWNCVETDPFQKGKAYFAGTKYKSDDFTPYIFKTEDYGKTWKLITAGITSTHFTRCIRADKKRKGLLYCGTEYGMYVSYDDGAKWRPLQLNLPVVSITDLAIKENDLIVATQGRSFWVLDDLSMIQQYDAGILQKNVFLADVYPAYRYDGWQFKHVVNAGMNPPNGVVMNFYLKEVKDTASVTISIKDKNRKEIKTFSTKPFGKTEKLEVNEGMNQFVWDMYYPPAEKTDGMILWNGGVDGPRAAPGKYYVEIKSGNDLVEKEFEIKANPVHQCTQADYEAQFDFLISVRDKFSEVQKTIREIREIRGQLNDFASLQGKNYPKEVKVLADSIGKQMTTIEEALYQTKLKSNQDILNYPMRLNDKISGIYNYAASGNNAPTRQVKEAFAELASQADVEIQKWKKILETDITALNAKIREMSLPVIGLKKEK
ncbi:MAG: WD40/YVTN/BNR-like repeat-containing protein [Bacteroidota bacterium]